MIAGQGTIGLELAEQVPDVGTVRAPGRRRRPRGRDRDRAAGAAAVRPARRRAARTRTGYTIADGIAVKQPGELTMGILGELLDDLVEVSDDEISEAITLLLERAKLVVEGAGAVGVAALLHGQGRRQRPGRARSSPAATSTRRC